MLADLGIEKLVAREANRIMQFCLVTGIVIQMLVGPVLGNKDEPRLMEGTGRADRIPPFYDPFPTARLKKSSRMEWSHCGMLSKGVLMDCYWV